MQKRALVVGIDGYRNRPLRGCVKDAEAIATLLRKNGDATDNFDVHLSTFPGETQITKAFLENSLKTLFKDGAEAAVFYFAGHGHVDKMKSVLVTAESETLTDGVTMGDLLTLANNSGIPNKVILLDCCHSGALGEIPSIAANISHLANGLTIIAACRREESANEYPSGGVFTQQLIKGLEGEAAESTGAITTAGLYSVACRGLREPWIQDPQRPVYKTNVDQVAPIRHVSPQGALNPDFLRHLENLFSRAVAYLGKQNIDSQERRRASEALQGVIPPLEQLQQRLNDWGEGATNWIRDFYDNIDGYRYVYSTDLEERASIGQPKFERYLRHQYSLRAEALNRAGVVPAPLMFSRELKCAVERTGWEPSVYLWKVPKLGGPPEESCGAEFARILIRPVSSLSNAERDALYVLDLDHKIFGIPLFVIAVDQVEQCDLVDCTLALNARHEPVDAYQFNEERGVVEGTTNKRRAALKQLYLRLLGSPALVTVPEHLGHVMIRDPEKSEAFSRTYGSCRKASAQLLDFIAEQVSPSPEKRALDLGCGTGNYTFAFAGEFKSIIGLDINIDMLSAARAKSRQCNYSGIEFVLGDAVNTKFEDEQFDAIWSVSTLHYLKGTRQLWLLKEAFRILRPGGRLVVDVGEFLEQHPSLWIAEYFPSLKRRYEGACHSVSVYRQWLHEARFRQFDCIALTYLPGEKDFFLRAGVANPQLYLDDEFRSVVPAFQEMREGERSDGLSRLRRDIESGEIERVIQNATEQASMNGDLGFLVATKARR